MPSAELTRALALVFGILTVCRNVLWQVLRALTW